MQTETEDFLRQALNLTDEIKLAGAEIHLSEKINWKQIETESYPFTGANQTISRLLFGHTGFLADTGGALGLFLGLSLLQIFSWIGKLWIIMVRGVLAFRYQLFGTTKVIFFS